MPYSKFVKQLHKPLDRPALNRDGLTLTAFGVLGLNGFLLNGIGSILAPLQDQLQTSRAAVAVYPSLIAGALVVVGLFGGRAVAALGHRRGLSAALVLSVTGVVLLGSPARWLTLVGAVLLGTGVALMISLVPAVLAQRHPTMAPAAFGEANAVASMTALIAPAAVAATLALGWGWRAGYILPALPAAAALLYFVTRRRFAFGGPRAARDAAPARALTGPGLYPGRLAPRLAVLFAAVSVEFCLVFWAAQALKEWHGADPATATALGATFLAGMAIVRAGSSWLTTGRHPLQVVLASSGLTLVGFLVFWTVPSIGGAAVGLLLAGGGVALMFPALLARAVSAQPLTPDRTTRLCALMSGLAIGLAPLVLARLADSVGLRSAYLVVPALLCVMAGYCLVERHRGRRMPAVVPAGVLQDSSTPTDMICSTGSPASSEAATSTSALIPQSR